MKRNSPIGICRNISTRTPAVVLSAHKKKNWNELDKRRKDTESKNHLEINEKEFANWFGQELFALQ